MKITKRQLEKIILESLSEEKFLDRVKAKGKDIKGKVVGVVDRAKGEIEDLRSNAGSEETNDTDGEPAVEPQEEVKSAFERLTNNSKLALGGNKDKLRLIRGGGDQRNNFTFMFTANLVFFRIPGQGDFVPIRDADELAVMGLLSSSAPDDMAKDMVVSLNTDLRDKFNKLGGKVVTDDQVGGRTDRSVNESESLSRGSLYRRRYYGRY